MCNGIYIYMYICVNTHTQHTHTHKHQAQVCFAQVGIQHTLILCLSYDRYIASSKASSSQSAI